MHCLSCGSALTPGATFCEQCGTAVAGAVGTATADLAGGVPGARPDGWTNAPDAGSGAPAGGLRGTLGRGAASGAPSPTSSGVSPAADAAVRYQGASTNRSSPAHTPSVPVVSGGLPPSGAVPGEIGGGYPGGYDPTMAMATARSSGGSSRVWFLAGGGVALIAVVMLLVFAFLGKATSSKFSSVGDSISSADGGGNDVAAGPSEVPTTESVAATQIDGVWPSPASWAVSRCGSKDYQAVTSIETSQSRAAICADDAAGYYYQGYGLKNHLWSPWLTADYSEDGQQFVATSPGGTTTTYTVTPSSLAVTIGGRLNSFQYASSSRSRGKASQSDLLAQLESLMDASATYRGSLTDFVNATYAGDSCIAPSDASTRIESIRTNRSDMLDASQRLEADAAGTSVASAAGDFSAAMQASLSVDEELANWVDAYWTSYAEDGCSGSVTQPDDAYSDYTALNDAATAAKKSLAEKVNALAAGTPLKSDWTFDKI
jgi:hypothetical protein